VSSSLHSPDRQNGNSHFSSIKDVILIKWIESRKQEEGRIKYKSQNDATMIRIETERRSRKRSITDIK